jgi:Flp pilus assembly protein TadG
MIQAKASRRGPSRIRRSSESGQALTEMALTTVFILAPLLIGAGEFARAAYCYIEVSNAARAAVQYGAQTHATVLDTQGMLNAAQNDYSLDPTRLSLPTATTACNCSDTGASVSCSSSTACNGAHIEINLTVTAQATFDPGFYEPFLSNTFTIQSTAVQKVLQ